MWRRNGISLINQAYYTRDYRCRVESFDRDLQLLQIYAGFINPDEMFATLINKFNLLDNEKIEEVRTLTYHYS